MNCNDQNGGPEGWLRVRPQKMRTKASLNDSLLLRTTDTYPTKLLVSVGVCWTNVTSQHVHTPTYTQT